MKVLISLAACLWVTTAFAECMDGASCRSQLVRLEVNNNFLNNQLNSPAVVQSAVPMVNQFLTSEAFRRSFLRDYPMEPLGFPFNAELCASEKARGSRIFRDVNCEDPMLCSNASVSMDARAQVCFQFPCPLLMGRDRRQCPASGSDAMPTRIQFPRPIHLTALDNMRTVSAAITGNQLRACVEIGSMEVSLSTQVEFARDPAVNFENVGLDNLRIRTDGPRQVCLTARVDLRANPLVSHIQLDRGATDFVSNAMIDQALAQATPVGLSGYSAETVDTLKRNLLGPLVRHFRPAMETAIQGALATNFQEQMSGWASGAVSVPVGAMGSEMSLSNTSFRKYVDLMDCALLKAERRPVPATHACLRQIYPVSADPLRANQIPSVTDVARLMARQAQRNEGLSSLSIQHGLEAFRARMTAVNASAAFNANVAPIIASIQTATARANVLGGLQIITSLGDGNHNTSATVVAPEICDTLNPSPYANLTIPNCPVQAFVDLNEMNRLLTTMYRTGALCNSGRGDYVPQTDRSGNQAYNRDGSPRGTGCLFAIEESDDGMRCYLKGAPQIHYDASTRGYKVQLQTRACFRGPVLLGQGKIGGDINFTIGFTPSVCDGGDFCLENGHADWEVVRGTARFGLRESSFFNGMVRSTIDKKLSEMIGQTIRIPLARGSGMLGNFPLVGEGAVLAGEGYFGTCLRPIEGNR